MKRYRLPRKLKKGCLTLSGNPRTRWQRKGRIYAAKVQKMMSDAAVSAVYIGMEALRIIAERRRAVDARPGGIVVPQPERMTVGEQAGEIILRSPQLDQLRHVVNTNPVNSMKATVSMAKFSDIIKKINSNLKENKR